MTKKERYEYILNYFKKQMPVVTTELHFGSAFQLLCATLLSAQCTDKRINMVTPELFRRFPTAKEMSQADEEDIFDLVKSVSYPRNKSRHLLEMSKKLMEQFGGEVPESREALISLPGVGRKTANVVQAVWFGKAALAVDTHVYRVSRRLGLVSKTADTPLKVERELMKHIPKEQVTDAHHWILLHGRYVCTSRAPHCDKCPFTAFCPKNIEDSKLS